MLPPSQRSLWSETAVAAPSLGPLTGPVDTEVAIIGAGIAGLSVALALAERGVATTVIEAGDLGDGASGRNGGQVIGGLRHLPDELIEAFGAERGRRLHEFGLGTARAAFDLIHRHGLDCDAVQEGWINAADSSAALDQSRRRVLAWQKKGVAARLLQRDELAALTGTQAYLGGWILPGSGSVQPLSLVRELARVATAAGANIHIRSRATRLARDGSGWRVETAGGHVRARRILLATNALADGLVPALAKSLLPVWSFQIATEPGMASGDIMRTDAVVSDTRRVLRYFRKDRDGRIIVGGKGAPGGPRGPASFDLQLRMLRRLFPTLARADPAYWWGGQVAITLDRLPRLFVLGDGAFATLGCNGKGVAWNLALGPILAEALTGTAPDTLPLPPARPPSPIPFHAFKRVYASAGSAWLRLRDKLERDLPSLPQKAQP